MSDDNDLRRFLTRVEAAPVSTSTALDRDNPDHVAFEALATACMAAVNDLTNALRKKHDGYIRTGGAALRAGDQATATAEFAKADAIKPERDQAELIGFQLDRAIIAWLDAAADVAAAKAAIKGVTADLKAEKDAFARTADNLNALASALTGVGGVIKAVQGLLADPA